MGLPVCIFNIFIPIFPISCHLPVPYLRNFYFRKFGFPSIYFFVFFSSNLVFNNLKIMLFFMPPMQARPLF
jgi:hypothetical protein